jgi:hypothetical protein
MKEKNGAGLVVYGAGHFDGHAERLGGESIFKLAKKAGFASHSRECILFGAGERSALPRGLKRLERSFRPASVDFIFARRGKAAVHRVQ